MSEKRDPHDGEYIGNLFGSKMTLYGGIFILLLVAFMVYRHWSMGVPFGMTDNGAPTVPAPSELVE